MDIAVYSTKNFEIPYLEKANEDRHNLKLIKEHLGTETVKEASQSEAVILFPTDDASAEVLDQLKELGIKYVATRSAGFDHIDLDHARQLELKVSNVPKYSPNAIAEHAVGLMLNLNRKILVADNKVHEYDFRLDGLTGFDMNGKTVGIIGAGKIGSIAAKILSGFGCRILIYDPVENKTLVEKYSAEYVSLKSLCQQSDIITIHAPINKETEHLINRESISWMKDEVMIINSGRGKIINTEDLLSGLMEGKIGSVGLDVYEYEKGLFFNDLSNEQLKDPLFAQLLGFKNVLITAHQAFLTKKALTNMAGIAFKNINDWAVGNSSPNEI